jgi:putative ABC transport system substrate-binding protein
MSTRREFITLLGGAAAGWPMAARAQQPAISRIGFLHVGSKNRYAHFVAKFLQALSEAGFVEPRNLVIEYRWADDHYDQLPSLAADLVRQNVAAIVAWGPPAARAAKAATAKTPIVFLTGGDPIAEGLVESINRPEGNVTGISFLVNQLVTKRLQLLHELVPTATLIAMLVNPGSPTGAADAKEAHAAARTLGVQLHIIQASTEDELDRAFATLAQMPARALLIGPDPFFTNRRDRLVALTSQRAIPTMHFLREFVDAGGLISYGASLESGYRQVGLYTNRVLKGDKPADLPVQQSTQVDLVINLKTAKALGLEVPPMLLARADEVIE